MSSRERNKEKRREREAEATHEEEERARLAARSLWQKIEDCQDVHDIREVLHEIAEKAGIDEWVS